MKNCNDIQSLFSEFYDDNNNEIAMHLDTCIECKHEFEKYAQLMDEVRTLPIPEPPEDFHFMLMAGVQHNKNHQKRLEQEQRKISFQRRFSFATTAVAACFLMAVIWFGGFFETRNESIIHDYVTVTPFATFDGISELGEDIPVVEPESFWFSGDTWRGALYDENVDIEEDIFRARRIYDEIDGVQGDVLPSPPLPAQSFGIESIEATPAIPAPQPYMTMGRGEDLQITHEEYYPVNLSIMDEIHYNQNVNLIWIIALAVGIIILLLGVITSIGLSIKLRNSLKSSTI